MSRLAPLADAHTRNSTLRERIVEHVFVGEVLRVLWCRGVVDAEVLRSEFDAHGYDLVMGRGPIVRHIQFKTGTAAKPGDVSVSTALAGKPSGCVLWIRVTPRLGMGPFDPPSLSRTPLIRSLRAGKVFDGQDETASSPPSSNARRWPCWKGAAGRRSQPSSGSSPQC